MLRTGDGLHVVQATLLEVWSLDQDIVSASVSNWPSRQLGRSALPWRYFLVQRDSISRNVEVL